MQFCCLKHRRLTIRTVADLVFSLARGKHCSLHRCNLLQQIWHCQCIAPEIILLSYFLRIHLLGHWISWKLDSLLQSHKPNINERSQKLLTLHLVAGNRYVSCFFGRSFGYWAPRPARPARPGRPGRAGRPWVRRSFLRSAFRPHSSGGQNVDHIHWSVGTTVSSARMYRELRFAEFSNINGGKR